MGAMVFYLLPHNLCLFSDQPVRKLLLHSVQHVRAGAAVCSGPCVGPGCGPQHFEFLEFLLPLGFAPSVYLRDGTGVWRLKLT